MGTSCNGASGLYYKNDFPFRFVYDNNYFNDEYQGIPKGGYNKGRLKVCLKEPDVRLGTNYFSAREELDSLVDKVLFTGCIDEYYDFRFGHLEYRSLRFEHERLKWKIIRGMRSLIIVKERFLIPVLSNINISNLVSSRIR